MKFRRFIPLVLIAFCVNPAFAQLNNKIFEDRMAVEEADSGRFFVGLNALGFLKNNEYTGTIIDGYTLFGYQFQPYVSYNITKNVRIDAGGYFQKDFGNNSFSALAPVFSVKWRKKQYSVIFGNLEGSLNHRLIEPLFDFERVLNNRLETGVQFQIQQEDLFLDTWIDWQYMQYWRDTKQEQLVAGLSAQKRILRIGRGDLSVPVQLLARHQGGQLDVAGLPIQTLFNTALGLNWSQPMNGLLRQVTLNGFYVYDNDITNARQAYKDGSGLYANATLSTKFGLDVMASYWNANEFIGFEGGKIYPSVSYFDPSRTQPASQLMVFRFLYDYKVAEHLFLSLRYEPYFDLTNHTFQYSYGVYLNYRDRYLFHKKR
ncbi:hypothetical protein BH09BAC3_BH09BAC3_34860 [soil metagenome]